MGRKVEVDIAKFLEGDIPWLLRQSTASAQSKQATLYLGELPAATTPPSTAQTAVPIEAASISEYPGENPDRTFGNARKIEKPRIIIAVRAKRYDVAQDRAYEIHDAIDGKTDIIINGTKHVWMGAVSLPSEGTPDGQNNSIFNGNYMIWREIQIVP